MIQLYLIRKQLILSAIMSKTVCVTGVTGYLASELTTQLLERGYTVHGTARQLHDAGKMEYVNSLKEKYPNNLFIHQADVLNASSLQEPISRAEIIFHTASPFFASENPLKDLVEPAIEGTRNVFSVAAESDLLKRIIVTSSIAAVRSAAHSRPSNGQYYTAADWNNESTIDMPGLEPYLYSKSQAEKLAWELAAAYHMDLVCVNPGFIVGPPRSRRPDGTSLDFMRTWLEQGYSTFERNYVDVRDVALAHILAAESPSASGRYICCSEHVICPAFVAKALRAEERLRDIVQAPPDDAPLMDPNKSFDTITKLSELGLTMRPFEESFVDMAKAFLDLGLVTIDK